MSRIELEYHILRLLVIFLSASMALTHLLRASPIMELKAKVCSELDQLASIFLHLCPNSLVSEMLIGPYIAAD